jgi:RNA polymerase sigma-70 factor (ECF subfamily)
MMDNELTAEQLSSNTFLRAFASSAEPRTEQIDQAFLAEIREITTIGTLTLNSKACAETRNVRGNVKRVHLERAVVQLPSTEKMIFLLHDVEGYEHEKIAHLLGLSVQESQFGLHQARLQMRELISRMS